MGLIYQIQNNINLKRYIGKTSRSFNERKAEHLRSYQYKDTILYRAMRKYGVENFTFSILKDNIPEDELSQAEQDYIHKYNTYYTGYNMTFGGDGESNIDKDIIISLFLQGKNCTEIAQITNHTRKTVRSVLQRNGYDSSKNKNNKIKHSNEIKVGFNNLTFNSLTELAHYLQLNYPIFSNKCIATIVQGISRSLKNNSTYYTFHFYYL